MKAAIIGCGLIGKKRASGLPTNVNLVGCFDSSVGVAEDFALEFNTEIFASIDELLAIADLDMVIIATRHDALATLSMQALDAGINVLVEKPGAIDHKSFRQVAEKLKDKELLVHVGYNHRFHPALKKAFELVSENAIGKLMFVRGRYGHGGRLGYEKEWRADKAKSGGGELIDQGTHLLDLSMGLLGNLELDYAATPNYFWDMPVEDNAFISIKNAEGCIAFLQASCTEWKNMFSLEIYGQTGKLDISGLGRSYGVETLTFHKMLPEMGPPDSETWTFPDPDNSWSLEIEEFVADLVTGTRNSDNVASSLEVLRIIEEIYVRTGR